jgi:hypothetical protein
MALNLQDTSSVTQRVLGINNSSQKLEVHNAAGALMGVALYAASGSSSGTGTEQTLDHGLGVAPAIVVISPTATGMTDAYESNPADVEHIFITANTGVAYKWLAIVVG